MEGFIIKPGRVKVRKGSNENVRHIRVHQTDSRRKNRAQSKRAWRNENREYIK